MSETLIKHEYDSSFHSPTNKMASSGSYLEELQTELKQIDPNSHSSRLLTQEIDRLVKGEENNKEPQNERPVAPHLNLHNTDQQKCNLKIKIPIKEFPRYNFVGKLLGPKGSTLKQLQDQTGCKMAIMGKGSMREKEKEEELRKQGGKFAHLNEDLHVLVECYSDIIEGHHRMAAAMVELRKFLIPEVDYMDESGDGMGGDMGMNGGAPRGRGGYRGGAPERGRGSFRGRGNGHAPPAAGRGAPMSRGGPPRGAPRGGPAVSRGGPPSRGAPPAARGRAPPPAHAPAPAYDSYGSQQSYSGSGGYSSSYDTYEDTYAQDSYYDYGQTGSSSAGYDSYSGGYGDYNDGWGSSGMSKPVAPPSRGASRGARAHPYSRPSAGGY